MQEPAPVVVVVPSVVVVEADVDVVVEDVVVVVPGRFEGWARAFGFRTWMALHRANPAGAATQAARCSTATELVPWPGAAVPAPTNEANATPVTAARTATCRRRLD